VHPNVAEVEAELNDVWRQAEPLIEQYNAVHEQYVANKAKQDELLAAIAPLARQLDLAQAQIGAMAARAPWAARPTRSTPCSRPGRRPTWPTS
jgi:ABC-type transporter Mla subunit MlaD